MCASLRYAAAGMTWKGDCAQALRERGVAATGGRYVEKKKRGTGGLCATSTSERKQARKKAKGRKVTRIPEDRGQSGRIAPPRPLLPVARRCPAARPRRRWAQSRRNREARGGRRALGGDVGDVVVLREGGRIWLDSNGWSCLRRAKRRPGSTLAGVRQASGGANDAPNTKVTARECLAGIEYGEESATTSVRGYRRKC